MNEIFRLLDPIKRRILLLVGLGRVSRIDDSRPHQIVQAKLLKNEIRDTIVRLQNYGWSSYPVLKNSDGLFLFKGGNREDGYCISLDNRNYRFKNLKEGEHALYTDEGDLIHFKRGNVLSVKTKTLNFECDDFNVTASNSVNISTGSYAQVASGASSITASSFNVDSSLSTFTGDVQVDGKLKVTMNILGMMNVQATVGLLGVTLGISTPVSSGGISSGGQNEIGDLVIAYNAHTHGYVDDGIASTTSTTSSPV